MRTLIGLAAVLALAGGPAFAQSRSFGKPAPAPPGSLRAGAQGRTQPTPSWTLPKPPAPSVAKPRSPMAPEPPAPSVFKPYEPWKPTIYGPDGKTKR